MNELLTNADWLWPLAWQSTVVLAAGLGASVLLRHRPVRGHQALLLALTAVGLLPVMTYAVRQHRWGFLETGAPKIRVEHQPIDNAGQSPAPRQTPGAYIHTGRSAEAAVANAPVAPARGNPSWVPSVFAVWFTASVVLLMRLLLRFWRGLRLVAQAKAIASSEIALAVEKAKQKLQIRTDVLIHGSKRIHSPVIWCWSRYPLLLVPTGEGDARGIDWESVVCHELAHWKRHDHVAVFFAELFACVLPWQILLWLVRHRLLVLSEEACDDWVLASGQTPTRYARTLLSLTPQGRAALVPAVVTSRRGVAGRVRRIIGNRCADPRANGRWTLASALLALACATGIAFAQAGAQRAANVVKTDLGHGAVIAQLESVGTIEGVLVDPNGQPMDGRSFCVTALPSTYYAVEPDAQGRFRVPWSAAFNSDRGSSYLMATRNTMAEPNYAALVAVSDPTSPVAMHLEPAINITGQVLDSADRPVPNASVTVYLNEKLASKSPIAVARTRSNGTFSLWCLPRGQTYVLGIHTAGYEGSRISVDTTIADQRTVDVGKVVLIANRSTESQDIPDTEWSDLFQQIYSLDRGEVIRFVRPPFSPAREAYFIDGGAFVDAIQAVPYLSFTRYVDRDGATTNGAVYAGDGASKAKVILNRVLGIPAYEFSVSDDIDRMVLPRGDYVVRSTASTQEKLRALEQIVRAELRRSIRFEKRTVEQDTIVVTGRYAFTPLPGKAQDRLIICTDENARMHEDRAESLAQLLNRMADRIGMAVEDRTEPTTPTEIQYLYDDNLLSATRSEPIDKIKELPALLDNLTRQTGLTFTVKRQPREVWFAAEDASN